MNTIADTMPLADRINRLLGNNNFLYWTLQLAGWGVYVTFILLECWIAKTVEALDLVYCVMAAVLGLLITMVMRRGYQLAWNEEPVRRGLLTLAVLCLATGFWSMWKLYVDTCLHPSDKPIHVVYESVYWYSYSFFILLSWTGLYYGIKLYKLVQEEREKALRADAMAHQAQLKMLRYQLNPHFLFNTLNSISTLILDRDCDTANRMITQLSRFLRYSLDNDPVQKVALEQELQAMRLYLDIEKLRFGDRLQLQYDIGDAARPALIPSLLLQPLIENAIKYAVAANEHGATIRLAARREDTGLLLEVSDDGPGLHGAEGNHHVENGVGLDNIRNRLQVLYGERQSCRFHQRRPSGLSIDIRIPFETRDHEAPWKN